MIAGYSDSIAGLRCIEVELDLSCLGWDSCVRRSKTHAALELLAVAAAEAKPGFVFEEHLVVAVLTEREAADAIEIDDG